MRPAVKRFLVHGLLLLALLAPVFPGVFLRGEVIAPGDILFHTPPWKSHAPEGFTRARNPQAVDPVAAFLPWYALTTAALRSGELPLWNPLGFAGMPLLANFQSAVFYPPRLLHLVFGMAWGTTFLVLFKVWWCGMAAFICGRGIGLRWAMARFLSIAWMLSSYAVIWCNWPLIDVAGWLPILFLGVELALDGRLRRASFTLVLGGAMMLLAGHPETAFGMAVGLGVYLVARLVLERRWGRGLWGPAGVCAGAAALSLGICGVQLLPFLEYLPLSAHFTDRPGMDQAMGFPPAAAIGFWVPRYFGTAMDGNYFGDLDSSLYGMIYPGMAVWLGASLVLLPGARVYRMRIIALAIAASVGAALAWSVPPFNLVHGLPLFRTMLRCHHLGFCLFALPLLAAQGLQHAATHAPHWRDWVRVLAPALVAVAAVVGIHTIHAGLVGALHLDAYVKWQMLATLAPAVLCWAVMLLFAGRARLLAALFTVILALDLIYTARGVNPTMPAEQLYPDTELARYLQSIDPPARVSTATGHVPAGFTVPYGIEQWGAYDGLYPKRMMDFQVKLGPRIWDVMEPVCGITHYLNDPKAPVGIPVDDPERFRLEATLDGLEVYRNLKAYPRAFVVGGLDLVPDDDALFARMLDESYRPETAVAAVVTPELRAAARDLSPGAGVGEALVLEREPTHVALRAKAERPAVLVLSDAYYPGWRATVDGAPAALFPAYHVFRGLLLPPGEHVVQFVYRPASLIWGAALSGLSIALAAAVAWRTRSV